MSCETELWKKIKRISRIDSSLLWRFMNLLPSSSRCVGSAFSFRERSRHDVAWHHITRFPCPFSRFFNSIYTCNRQCEHKLFQTVVGKQFRDANKKSSHDLLEIISAASRADRSSADSHWSFFSQYFFLSPIPFSSSSSINSTWTGCNRTCHRSPLHPRRRHARLSTALGPVPFFCRDSLLYPSASEGVLRCSFLDLYVRVCRPFSSPLIRCSSLPLSISLNLLHSGTTYLSYRKILIVRRDTARTEMSCRRCRELAPSFDRYTW